MDYRALRLSLTLLAWTLLFGTIGYHYVEEMSFFDALYMTIITISTIRHFSQRQHMKNIAIIFLCIMITAPAGAMRCSNGIVSTGDTKLEVIGKCGEPDYLIENEADTPVENNKGTTNKATYSDRWQYNFGSNRFVYTVVFRDGVVKEIIRGGYGYDKESAPIGDKSSCGHTVSAGDTKPEVIAKCGEPVFKDAWTGKTSEPIIIGNKVLYESVNAKIEEWSYNFGPHRFMYTIRFEDGFVTDVTDCGYGFVENTLSASEKTRCGHRVSEGDTKLQVISKCGRPVLKDRRTVSHDGLTILLEDWSYNFGPTQFIYLIKFKYGRVTEIKRGGYGYHE